MRPRNHESLSPTARVAAGAFLISFSPVFVNIADVGPGTAAFYRLLLGGIVLTGLAYMRGGLRGADGTSLILAGICGLIVAIDLSVWHQSIKLIGPGLATILGNHQVFVLSLVGVVFLGERLTLRLVAAILLAVTGLFLIFGLEWGEFDARFRMGVFFGALTALLYASFLLVLRHAQSRPGAPDSIVTVAILSVVGAAALGAYVWVAGESLAVPGATTWVALISYAVLCHVVGWVLISTGLPGLEASRAGLILLLQPALAFVWDVVLFSRPVAAVEVLGATLALTAIYLGAAKIKDGEVD